MLDRGGGFFVAGEQWVTKQEPIQPAIWAYESEFDALQKFRDLETDALRNESLFFGMLAVVRKLDHANGTAKTTEINLHAHLNEHHDQQVALDAQSSMLTSIKVWGYRGTVALGALVALFGGETAAKHMLDVIKQFGG